MRLRELFDTVTGADTVGSDDQSVLLSWYYRCCSAERELWFLVAAVMLVDVTLTVHGLTIGLRELNPVARLAFERAGVLGFYGLKLGAVAVGLACRPFLPSEHTGLIPLALAVPSLIAVILNTLTLTRVLV